MAAEKSKKRKIAVLGSRSVGKSALVVKFVEDRFVDAYYPTIENTFIKDVHYKGVVYHCDIIDTAGQDEYSLLNSKHAIGIHGYVLVYSISSRPSFDMVKIVYEKIVEFCGKVEVPCVIVGTKSDLSSTRQVQATEVEALAKSKQAAWIETSAKNNLNIVNVFELCLDQIEKRSPHSQPDPPEPSKCIVM